jgi:hypothetical protein
MRVNKIFGVILAGLSVGIMAYSTLTGALATTPFLPVACFFLAFLGMMVYYFMPFSLFSKES